MALRTRHTVVHLKGVTELTALGVTMLLERLVDPDGEPDVWPGLYFPYQLIEPASYFTALEKIGGTVTKLDAR